MLLQALTPPLSASLFLPLSPSSPLYLSIIKVGIDPFTTLPLSGCSHKAQTCLPSLNQWHLPSSSSSFSTCQFCFFSLLHLSRLNFCTSQFRPFGFLRKYEKRQPGINLSWHKQVWWALEDGSGKRAGRVENGCVHCLTSWDGSHSSSPSSSRGLFIFCFVLFCGVDLLKPNNLPAGCQVNQWKISDIIVMCYREGGRKRERKI